MATALHQTFYASSQATPDRVDMAASAHQRPNGVRYGQGAIPCLVVVICVASSSKTKAEHTRWDAIKLKTSGVVNALDDSETPTNTALSTCAVATTKLPFVWTPPQSGTRIGSTHSQMCTGRRPLGLHTSTQVCVRKQMRSDIFALVAHPSY